MNLSQTAAQAGLVTVEPDGQEDPTDANLSLNLSTALPPAPAEVPLPPSPAAPAAKAKKRKTEHKRSSLGAAGAVSAVPTGRSVSASKSKTDWWLE
jgi:hypothetical protein